MARHLTQNDIRDIIQRSFDGETHASIAAGYQVDPSTISYHVNRFKRSYPEEGTIYAFVKIDVRKTCVHPSASCNFCGQMWDLLDREERDRISSLSMRLERANSSLRTAGLPVE